MEAIKKQEVNTYLKIAKGTNAFLPSEIELLEEVLDDYCNRPKEGYVIFDERRNDKIVGFVIFGRTPLTEFGWDMYWLAVEKELQHNGIGKLLIKKVEKYIMDNAKRAILRIETSTGNEYSHARNLYIKQGFKEVGRIKDFYAPEDDLMIFCKEI